MTASILGSSKSVYKRQTTSLLAFDLFSSFSMSCVLYNISLIGAVILCTYLAVFHLVFLVFSKYSIEYEKNSHLINYTEKCFLLLFFFIFSSSSVSVFFFFWSWLQHKSAVQFNTKWCIGKTNPIHYSVDYNGKYTDLVSLPLGGFFFVLS